MAVLQAMRHEEAMKREASEAKCFCELQALQLAAVEIHRNWDTIDISWSKPMGFL